MKFAAFLLLPLPLFQSCGDDDTPVEEEVMPPIYLGSGQASRTVMSEAGPQHGQKERSSNNFSTSDMGGGTAIYWSCPEGISFDVKIDKTGTDPFYANGITNGTITSFQNNSKFYIANPRNAEKAFEVQYTVFTPEDGVTYVFSAKDHMSGQSHRSSSNFNLPYLDYKGYAVVCPKGVRFRIMKDISGGNDDEIVKDVKDGDLINRLGGDNLYIADASGADNSFMVSFTPLSDHSESWMSHLSDDMNLYDISLPGTHDSGTKEADMNSASCQNYTIEEQLYDGIRFLDVRIDEHLNVNHGGISCHLSFKTVLQWCDKFLTENPSETIIMRLKEESGTIGGDLNVFFKDPANQKLVSRFLRDTRLHKLGECRGKIVLLRDFVEPADNGPWGIHITPDWPQDGSGTFETTGGVKFYVEDRFFDFWAEVEHDTMEKKSLIEESFKALSKSEYKSHLFITFNSIGMRGITTPYMYAWGGSTCDRPMNPIMSDLIKDYFEGNRPVRAGIIVLDYYNNHSYDDKHCLVQRIINLNFKNDIVYHSSL